MTTEYSPNKSKRVHGQDSVNLIVVHTPEGSYESAIATCMNSTNEVSYHALVKEDGTQVRFLVPYAEKAWHAKVYNDMSEGLAIAGYASNFSVTSSGTQRLASLVAARCHARKIPPKWDATGRNGICRHKDLQSDRSDPTPNNDLWKLFIAMVESDYRTVIGDTVPVPIPAWFWEWAEWRLGEGRSLGKRLMRKYRPTSAPKIIPPGSWPWRKLKAILKNRKGK